MPDTAKPSLAMLPLISVVVPVYNAGDRLNFMAESLKKQDYANLEIIICDDASTDGALGRLDGQYEKSFSNMRILRNEENRGVSFSRNRGIREARGEYVITVDADDMIEPNFISSLYSEVAAVGADYVSCGYRKLEMKTGAVAEHPLRIPVDASPEDILIGRILNRFEISHITTLCRRDFLIENNLFYTDGCTAGEDMEFLIKMLCCGGKGAFVTGCLYIYVQHEQMGSRKYIIDRERKVRRYIEHTEAQFRSAERVIQTASSKKLRAIGLFMMMPAAHLRRLSVCAMQGDRAKFDELRKFLPLRESLKGSWRALLYNPEVFLRSLAALYLPEMYYRHYRSYAGK